MDVRKLAACALLATATGCTVVPGSNMSSMNSTWFDEPSGNYEHAEIDIQHISIDASLLSHYTQNKIPDAQPYSSEMEQALASYQYRVGPGDVLTITVWEHPELTIPAGSFRTPSDSGNQVKADGTVFFPYAGDILVASLTLPEITQKIRDQLRSVIKNPQVDVRVADFQSQKVYVSGAVKNPSILPITNKPMTLIDAVQLAGGLEDLAAWDRLSLSRNGKITTFSLRELLQYGRWNNDIILQHGDALHVPHNDFDKVFVLGEVNRPQSLFIGRDGLTLAEGLASSNGINESRADGRGIYVLRNTGITRNDAGKLVYTGTAFHLNAAQATGFMLADQFPLQARDVVYVAPAPITRWNRFLSTLLPSILITDSVNDLENSN